MNNLKCPICGGQLVLIDIDKNSIIYMCDICWYEISNNEQDKK